VNDHSFAIYGEYARDANKVMQNGLNRRVFNETEAQAGPHIRLNSDGSITLLPGTYRLTGFSTVTMQTAMTPPQITGSNFPGYCMVYRKFDENSGESLLANAIAIGSGSTSDTLIPSLFDAIYTVDGPTDICVGHQSGDDLGGQVWLSIYEPAGGKPSEYHVMARIAITRM
jgi:hypothetical protein